MKNLISIERLTLPQRAVLDLQKTKDFLKLEHDRDDELLHLLIAAVGEKCENYTGQALIIQKWQANYENIRTYKITLPIKPVSRVDELKVTYPDGTQMLYNSKQYILDRSTILLNVTPIAYKLTVIFECGYGDTADELPAAIKSVLLEHIAHLYEYRGSRNSFDMKRYDEFKEFRI